MVAEIDDAKREQFREIFLRPTIETMHNLTPEDFELFVQHVFECAGYEVEYVARLRYPIGSGVDLNLYQPSREGDRQLKARVEVRRYAPDNLITLQAVREYIGTLHLAGGVHGFLITTSDFHQNAYTAENDARGAIRLINGAHLMRYIAYIGGSMYTDEHGIERTPRTVSPAWLFEADAVSRRNTKQSRVLTIANNRGGIGKTTMALNIGLAFAQQGMQVLLVDLDGQASLTAALPPPKQRREPRNAPPPLHARFQTNSDLCASCATNPL